MERDSLQLEARALGDPTRYSLFRFVVDAGESVTVAALTAFSGLNHNAVRQHLAVLVDAGLLVEEKEVRMSAGRPRLLYRLHPEAAGKWETEGPYAWLAKLLSEAIASASTPREAGRRAGRERARTYPRDADPIEAMDLELERNGFRPTRRERGRRVDFVLGRCPFVDVAAANPATVCQLHLGFAEGFADAFDGVEVEGLTANEAHHADCRLMIRRA
ncbi:MAG: helix-turn-helix domain-containing protein [Acidobacteriota bacterium]|nr:helix-turn-helix domain-containing protein [Acidobacteriota bacterium]